MDSDARVPEQVAALAARPMSAIYLSRFCQEVSRIVVENEEELWLQNSSGLGFQLLDAAPVSIFMKNREGVYTFLNAKAREFMGFAEKEVIGLKDLEFLSDPRSSDFRAMDEEVMANLRPQTVTEPWQTETGEYLEHVTTRYPIVRRGALDGPAVGVVSVAEDISYMRSLESAGEVLDLIAHDWAMAPLRAFDWRNISAEAVREIGPLMEFLQSYLMNLRWYFDAAPQGRTRDSDWEESGSFLSSCQEANLWSDIFFPVREVVQAFANLTMDKSGKADFQVDQEDLLKSASFFCHPPLLQQVIFQQARNHWGHGGEGPLKILVSEWLGGWEFRFCSPGERFENPFNRPTGTKSPRLDGTFRGRGLPFCEKIASLHRGEATYEYVDPPGENHFVFRFKDIRRG